MGAWELGEQGEGCIVGGWVGRGEAVGAPHGLHAVRKVDNREAELRTAEQRGGQGVAAAAQQVAGAGS